jgi:serine/threonine protein kinase
MEKIYMKLLMENWRKYLTEETDATGDMPSHLLRQQNRQKDAQALLKSMGFSVRRELGRGAFGVVYEVENNSTGERSAAKVVTADNKREIENYKFAMEEKAFMPEKYGKYLPDVKKLITGGDSTIILMELLEPLDPQTAQDLFAAQDAPTASIKKDKILKNPEAVAEITKYALQNNRILDQMREFLVNRDQIVANVINAVTKISHGGDVQSVIYTVATETAKQINFQSPAIKSSFEDALTDTILYYFDKQIIPVHQPEPGDEEVDRDLWAGPTFKTVEGLFPEAEGLMAAMKYFMKDKGWRPKDVHIKNVMRRPSTKDFVIVDLGLFKRGIY